MSFGLLCSIVALGGLAYTGACWNEVNRGTTSDRLKKHHISNLTFQSIIGERPYQEDRMVVELFGEKDRYLVVAVADGHCSAECAAFLKANFVPIMNKIVAQGLILTNEQLITGTSRRLHEKWGAEYSMVHSGSTLTGILLDLRHPGQVWTFNLGDSKSIILDSQMNLYYETKNHDLGLERIRQIRAKHPQAVIAHDHQQIWRLQGESMSLNLGGAYGNTFDAELDRGLLRDIEVQKVELSSGQIYRFVIGSDGVWYELLRFSFFTSNLD